MNCDGIGMDCAGLYWYFTIEDCTELQQDCLDWTGIVTDSWTCNRPLNTKNLFTIDKILTISIFSVNVNVVRLRDFPGSVYAHFPSCSVSDFGISAQARFLFFSLNSALKLGFFLQIWLQGSKSGGSGVFSLRLMEYYCSLDHFSLEYWTQTL